MDWHEFLLIAAAHFAAVSSPGPDFAVVMKQSLKHGQRAGTLTALGIANGILVHIFYCLIGFALLIKNTPWLFQIVRFGGAAYLLWIAAHALQAGWQGYHSRHVDKGTQEKTDLPAWKAWRQGFVTNVTNPKVTLFFLVLFTQVVSTKTPLQIRMVYGLEMVLVTAAWFILVAWLINRPAFRRGYERASWAVDGILGLVLLALVVKIVI